MATKIKLVADGVITADQLTLTTASSGTNTTAPATTAFVQQEVAALVDSAPGTLNTLNELAAALGDDANFSTTVTNSIATKVPLAGGTMTGRLDISHSDFDMLRLHQTDANGGFIKFTNTDDTDGWFTGIAGSEKYIISRTADNSTPIITIEQNGNVGIGTSSPSHKLDVNGTIGAQGAITSTLTSSGGTFLSIGHTGNENWTFDAKSGSGSTDYVDFGIAGGTRCMTWQEDGNVGIGETAPDAALHVKATGNGGHGTVKIEGENAHLGLTRADGNFRSWIGQYNSTAHGSDTDLNIKTGYVGGSSSTGNIRMSADGDTTAAQVYLQGSTGNLGINNTECSAKLHIEENGTGAITSLRLANENTSVGDGSQLLFTSGTSTSGAAIAGYGTALNQADLVFKSGGNSETMRLDSSGNLTIVAGSHTAANAGLTINSPVSNTFNHAINAFSANLTAGESILKVLGKSGSTKNAGYLGYTWNANASNENYVHLSHWGSNYLLRVYGNGNTMINNGIWLNGSGDYNNYNEGIRMAVQSGNNHAVIAWGAGSAGNVTSGGLPAHSMLYSTASNLYTQRNTNGSTIYSLTNGGALSIYGALSQNTSDERLKENITVIPNAITKLKGIRGVTFNWKETTPDEMALDVPSSGHDVGVLAQEVQAVLPEAVSLAPFDTSSETYSENDIDADVPMGDSKTGQNYLTVDYQKLVPLLIESIKELEARITELEG